MTNEAVAAAGPVVERFASSGGRFLGYATVALSAALVVIILLEDPGGGFPAICVIAAVALVIWVTLIRPSASVRAHGVLLQNMLRDSFIPSSKIVRCAVLQTLQVATEDRHFHCVGVSKSARSMMREKTGRRYGGLMLPDSLHHETAQPKYAEAVDGGSYTDYVSSRILRVAADAADDDREPVVAVAWPAVAALVAALVLVLVAFV